MSSTKFLAAKLLHHVEACNGTAEFLEAVQCALETLYTDSAEGCPAGFAALDSAIEAFRIADESQS